MDFLKPLFLIFIFLISKNLSAQNYISPLDINLLLSGTFGELRSNHFHAGIDIKTEGVEGQKVRAIANGYVSRIKVSSWGYGKTIYLTHPETGHTSVYAHLKKFSEKIDDLVKKEHYKKESFEIDFFPNKDALEIKQGEIIGLSGNSGSSNGAHLHFEIRESKTQHPINPLQFEFKITDNIPPILKKLKIYALDTTLISGYNTNQIYHLKKNKNNYYIEQDITINGPFALGIFTYDQSNNSYNKNGVYSIQLSVDNLIYYKFQVDELDFNTSRYINAHIDYCEKIENNTKYHKCYKLQNNKLENYSKLVNNGIISFHDTLQHNINLEISDIYGNTSNLTFKVQSTKKPLLNKCPVKKDTTKTSFNVSVPNIFKKEDITIHMEAFSLYEPTMFNYNTTDSIEGVFGKVHQIHYHNTPVHKNYALSLKANIPNELKQKTYIATTNMKGKFWYIGGVWIKDFIKTKTKEFGNFCIIADTTNPEIKEINIYNGKTLTNQNTIKVKIKDKHSGIKSFRGEINGEWILMDYDHKKNLLRFDIEDNIKKGEHTFTLQVSDNVGNTTNYTALFTY